MKAKAMKKPMKEGLGVVGIWGLRPYARKQDVPVRCILYLLGIMLRGSNVGSLGLMQACPDGKI